MNNPPHYHAAVTCEACRQEAAEQIAAWLDSEADAAHRRQEPDSALDYELMAKAIRRGDWQTVPRSET